MSELERFNILKEKVDSYNTKVIEKELLLKQSQEELSKLMVDLQTLGYSTIEEAEVAYKSLEEEVTKALDEMEAKLNVI